jgi:two-component SAPR family response regulator
MPRPPCLHYARYKALVEEQLTERVLGLYQDHFLASDEANSWSISLREHLRSKFIHTLLDMGLYWEKLGFREQAIQCYRKGVEVNDLIEVFYQRLMACYLETGRYSEGMATDRRCRQLFSIILSLQPEPETRSLYDSLRSARSLEQAS